MKILVNDIAASDGGALSILKSFYDYVIQNDHENEYVFLLGDFYLEATSNVQIRVFPEIKKQRIKRLMFDLFNGRKVVQEIKPDVIFSLQNTMIFGVSTIPQIVYMHQSIPFQDMKRFSFFDKDERGLAVVQHLIGKIIIQSVKKADYIFVQTEWIRDAVLKKTGICGEKIIDVFPEYESITCERKQLDNTLFFYPAKKDVYKNHECILNAVEILREKGLEKFEVLLTTEGVDTDNLKHIGAIPHQLVLEYLQRGTLLFPSYIETVGLPMLEVRSVNGLVLASDCPFSHEVLEGYNNAYFFDPFNAKELAKLMEQIIEGSIVRKELNNTKFVKSRQGWKVICDLIRKEGFHGREYIKSIISD